MSLFKKLTKFLVLPMALSLAVAGCGTGGDTAKEGAEGGAEKTLLEQIKADGTFKIGTEGTYAPFTYHDKEGKLTGFDVEIATEVAKRLGVEPEFVETQWDGMFAGLDSKRFDMVANQVSIRADRLEKYDFSTPYIVSKAVLITHEDNTDVKDWADMKGKKSAQSLTSNLTDIAKANGAEIVATEGFNQAIDLLTSKRVDVTVNDGLSFLDLKKQKPDVAIKVVAEHPDKTENGLLFRKGNEDLVKAVNDALAAMKEDGTYLKISEKYFGADVSK